MDEVAAILFGLLLFAAMLCFPVYLLGRLYAAFRGRRMSVRARWGAGLLVLVALAMLEPESSYSFWIGLLVACALGGLMRLVRAPPATATRT